MLNNWNGIGRLGRNAELKTNKNGTPSTKFTIAVDREPKDNGVDWIPCSLYGDRARILTQYLTKGKLIGITGLLSTYKTDKNETKMIVNVDKIHFLPGQEIQQKKDKEPELSDMGF